MGAEVLGAYFVYTGSRFIPFPVSSAVEDYKNMIINSSINDILYTDTFHAGVLNPLAV
ncbi:hypothetical protein [Virgibacillus litoralis]|uniref:NAD(P)H-dependent flavin oxidoreductase YrpB (Nitropropane dioxygenase family) n=1 Tax=Virgibacillus litoralis TaxID=578221 RepID=A0ABS4H8D6_9BACI|nr:hypothetical protein [Virgibacillus litoralis]MBP1947133.1 NAD(P)H-dependent flavin oxidoreductase YrpB (nitropropane dioxygenase family) [Virgibacillus litoralis]